MSTVYNNHSYFWRHAEQFDSLAPLLTRFAGTDPLRIWCAGCAYGEEAYSLALLLDGLGMKADILATDISKDALQQVEIAQYKESKIKTLPRRYLNRLERDEQGWSVPKRLKSVVRCRWDDLRSSRVEGPFDLILCRNVLIYFPGPVQEEILHHLGAALTPRGLLVLGYAEPSLLKIKGLTRLSDHAIFMKDEPLVELIGPPLVPGVSLLSEALSSYARGHLEKADKLLDASLEEDPLSPIGLYFKGMLDLESGRPERARRHLERILETEQDKETDDFLREHGLDIERFHLTVRRVLERLGKRC